MKQPGRHRDDWETAIDALLRMVRRDDLTDEDSIRAFVQAFADHATPTLLMLRELDRVTA